MRRTQCRPRCIYNKKRTHVSAKHHHRYIHQRKLAHRSSTKTWSIKTKDWRWRTVPRRQHGGQLHVIVMIRWHIFWRCGDTSSVCISDKSVYSCSLRNKLRNAGERLANRYLLSDLCAAYKIPHLWELHERCSMQGRSPQLRNKNDSLLYTFIRT